MKHIKLFEEHKHYEISDDLIKDGLDEMLYHYLEIGKDAGPNRKFTDMIDNIEYFYDNGKRDSRYDYHVEGWKEILYDIIYERMCYHIVEEIKKEPDLYQKHKKFVEKMLSDSNEHELEDWMRRGYNTGLLDTKIK